MRKGDQKISYFPNVLEYGPKLPKVDSDYFLKICSKFFSEYFHMEVDLKMVYHLVKTTSSEKLWFLN